MGYYTSYTLEIQDADGPLEEKQTAAIVAQLFEISEDARFALDEDGGCNQAAKWYESDIELKELSELHPDLLFIFYGQGEDNEDMWMQYFKNGKMQFAPAVITYAEFDESKLVSLGEEYVTNDQFDGDGGPCTRVGSPAE